jgi:transposase InsO family protein
MDHGGEYSSTEFKSYLCENGIVPEYTVPGNPQQNGKSERLGWGIWKKANAFSKG